MTRKSQTVVEGDKGAQEAKHPLQAFVPIIFYAFAEWLARWKATDYLAEKLGLLHYLTG